MFIKLYLVENRQTTLNNIGQHVHTNLTDVKYVLELPNKLILFSYNWKTTTKQRQPIF